MIDFLDLFNHRFVAFYYRAWEKNSIYFSYQRHIKNSVKKIEKATVKGLNRENLLFYYSGLFSQYPRNAANLQQLLSDYFQLPIKIKPYQGTWQRLMMDDYSKLSRKDNNNKLGSDIFLGSKLYSFQSKIQILNS